MTDTLCGNTSAAIDFLRQWKPNGPWQLTAILKDEGRIETQTFDPSSEARLRAWIDAHQGAMNLYFTVNPLLAGRSSNKKPSKQDIKELAWLHVDIDPRAGENIDEEKQRALGALAAFDPPPTVVIDSGGGIQAFWKLAEPLPIDGDLDRAREAEGYNRALEQHFGADHCHNCDRIMRLAGSVNIPDVGKRRRGRLPARAQLLTFEPARVYEISRFKRAALPQLAPSRPSLTPASDVSLHALPESVRPLTMVDAPQGERSEPLFAALCAMAREGLPRELALAVIMDSKFPISASVRDKRRPAEYAERQVTRAYAATGEPDIARLNEEYAVICIHGDTKIVRWQSQRLYDDGSGFNVPEFWTAASFKLFLANRSKIVVVGNDTKRIPLAEYWLKHPARRTYVGVEFAPGADTEIDGDDGLTRLNLWSGWGVAPKAGDWSRMRYHIEQVLADGDQAAADYILRWAAWSLQNPDKRAEVALVFRGGKGIGKSTFGVALCRIFGAHAMQVSDRRDLVGQFNAHMMQCAFLFADEALWPGHKEDDGPLKRLITEPTLSIEPKGVDKFSVPNHLHVMIAGNADWLVPASADERRFAVFKVNDRHRGDRDYFKALNHEMSHGGLAAMMHDLLNLDLNGWHPRDDIPDTQGLREQKERSLSSEEQWIVDLLTSGALPGSRPNRRNWARSKELFEHARRSVPRLHNMSDQQLATIVKRWGAVSRSSGGSGWEFPPLGDMRARWQERYPGTEFEAREGWDAPEEERCSGDGVF